ncbi:MAG: YbaN family protein [Bacteroidia bacterium]|nr:YbaN family protein [Bacteroidia bacterium]
MNNKKQSANHLRKQALIVFGTFFAGLGVLGIFLPLLPTTPFLLLAAMCYVRSSRKFYIWLINIRWLGNYIQNYREGKGIPVKVKVFSISFLWFTIGFSFFIVQILFVRIILILIAVSVTIHILLVQNFIKK